jgi:hypothetical protein
MGRAARIGEAYKHEREIARQRLNSVRGGFALWWGGITGKFGWRAWLGVLLSSLVCATVGGVIVVIVDIIVRGAQ